MRPRRLAQLILAMKRCGLVFCGSSTKFGQNDLTAPSPPWVPRHHDVDSFGIRHQRPGLQADSTKDIPNVHGALTRL
jgi:hypothetical protein